jgi:hypothetical protein
MHKETDDACDVLLQYQLKHLEHLTLSTFCLQIEQPELSSCWGSTLTLLANLSLRPFAFEKICVIFINIINMIKKIFF